MTAAVNPQRDAAASWDASQWRFAPGTEAGFGDRNQGQNRRKAASRRNAHRLRQFALSP
jgi:hypothetical protein